MTQTPNQIDVIAIHDIKVEDGILEVPLDAEAQGRDGKIRLRLDIENAKNLIGRLQAGIVTATVQLRRTP